MAQGKGYGNLSGSPTIPVLKQRQKHSLLLAETSQFLAPETDLAKRRESSNMTTKIVDPMESHSMTTRNLTFCFLLICASLVLAPIASVSAQIVPLPGQNGSDIVSKGGTTTTTPGSAYGNAICNAGDFNGDGSNDLIVGSRGEDTGATDAGMIEVISGADQSVLFSFMGSAAFDQFGYSVHCAGDVNGDGFADVIVGAPFADPGMPNAGQVVVINGGDGTVIMPGILYTVSGPSAFALFGEKVRRIGDIDGDSIGDLLVSARGFDSGRGAVHILSGVNGAEIRVIEGDAIGDFFGASIASIPDITGDNVPDIVVGAIGDDDGGNGSGSMTVLDSSLIAALTASDLASSVVFAKINGNAPYQQFGTNVSSAGDYDGDGVFDIIVGNPSVSEVGKDFCGEVKVFSGLAIDTAPVELFSLRGISSYDQFGIDVCDAGDVNGDGYDDVLVGTYKTSGAFNPGAGTATVIFGHPLGMTTFQQSLQGTSSYDFYGSALTSMGDIDNDGFSDFAVGAYADHTTNGDDTGSVRVYTAFDPGAAVPTTPYPVYVYHSEARRDLETLQMRWDPTNGDPNATTGTVRIKSPDSIARFVYFVSLARIDAVVPFPVPAPVSAELLLLADIDPANVLIDFTNFMDPGVPDFFFNVNGDAAAAVDLADPAFALIAGQTVYIQILQIDNPALLHPFRWSNGLAMFLP